MGMTAFAPDIKNEFRSLFGIWHDQMLRRFPFSQRIRIWLVGFQQPAEFNANHEPTPESVTVYEPSNVDVFTYHNATHKMCVLAQECTVLDSSRKPELKTVA